jgi:hypothetical protein
MRVSACVVRRFERAAQNGVDSENVEVVRGNDAPDGTFGPIAYVQRCAADVLGNERLHQFAVFLQILKVGPGNVRAAAAVGAGHCEHTLLPRDLRERTQQNAFDPTEDRGGRGDAKRQAEYRNQRKSPTAEQHPDTDA